MIKASNLTLKYLVRLRRFRIVLLRAGAKWLGYGVEVPDDPEHPALLWSMLETEDELGALRMLMESPKCTVFLFNEALANVAWAEAELDLSSGGVRDLVESSSLAPEHDSRAMLAMQKVFALMEDDRFPSAERVFVDVPNVTAWHPIHSTYITNRAQPSPLSIFAEDEGGQQEELALWLIDGIRPDGAVKSPQIHEPGKVRELSDLLLSHEFGAFLFESKTLSILARDDLPSRPKLTRALVKHLDKATGQLVGGLKNLQRGYTITDLAGNEVEVNRTHLPHVVILVPDLSLLSDEQEYGGAFFARIMEEAGAFFHILDPAELLRMVQAANIIAERSERVTPIQAFDFYLMERAKLALNKPSPYFGMLIRRPGEITVVENE
ncbi:MAG: hypothetical protein Q7J28_11780 [Caulobacter sp.]|nr:hypothetical protein [Caulobacter sp.]